MVIKLVHNLFQKKKGRIHRIPPSFIGFAVVVVFLLTFLLLNGSGDKNTRSILAREDDVMLGDRNAPVVMVEYSDYQCPFCGRFFRQSLPLIKSNYVYTGKVLYIYRDFPLYGKESWLSANAAHCAEEQGKFWEYHDLLYEKQVKVGSGTFSLENLKTFGEELGLEKEALDTCLEENRYEERIRLLKEEAESLGVWGTPTFFINKVGPLFGSRNYKTFEDFIEGALEAAGAN